MTANLAHAPGGGSAIKCSKKIRSDEINYYTIACRELLVRKARPPHSIERIVRFPFRFA